MPASARSASAGDAAAQDAAARGAAARGAAARGAAALGASPLNASALAVPASPQPTAYKHCYVHVPFCARRCSYCDFAIAVRRVVPWQEYATGLAKEWSARNLQLTASLETLYFGGGTPSSLGIDGVPHVLDWMRSVASLAENAEVTLEANPEDITPEAIAAWRRAGINRLSIGVQSFDDKVLKWMHRVHDASAAQRAAHIARDGGIASFSIDLIFAVPSELDRDWNRDLDLALALNPDHISLYGLTVEPRTPLGKWEARGDVTAAPEEQYEEQFLTANSRLQQSGYEHYEVSNFGKPGKRAVHNSAYWTGAPYLGLGPSAHGFSGSVRRWNDPVYSQWVRSCAAGSDPVAGAETLDAGNRLTEKVYLGLRTRDGLELEAGDAAVLAPWFDAGWIEPVKTTATPRVRCTPLGWLRLDALASALTALRSR